jgi:hypothetical protein
MIFISYTHADGEFALRLAHLLKELHVDVWIDRLDIPAGAHWDDAIQEALTHSECIIVLLTPSSVTSRNVLDEVAFGLEENKLVIPILVQKCQMPLRLRRLQYIDFTTSYDTGISHLVRTLGVGPRHQVPVGSPVEAGELDDITGRQTEGFANRGNQAIGEENAPTQPAMFGGNPVGAHHQVQHQPELVKIRFLRRLLLLYSPATARGRLWQIAFHCILLVGAVLLIGGLAVDGLTVEFTKGLAGTVMLFGPPLLVVHYLARRR